jgi:ABC-type glycerol-3-phosphate transport system permease component
MFKSERNRRLVTELFRYTLMFIIAAIMILPLAWLFVSSIRPAGSVFQYTSELSWRTFIPQEVSLENYRYVLGESTFPRVIFNTVFVSLTTVVLATFVNSIAGFAFAVFTFRGKNLLFIIVLITFMMPFESIVIPLYILIRALGWVNSYEALIIPAIANGFVIFLYRQFLASIPRELYEAAHVDGASWWSIYWRIAMPLAWPTTVTAMLMVFLLQWEAFFWPLVAASAPDYTMIQVAIARNINFEEAAWGRLFATTTIATVVPMLLYLFLQRYYTRSILSSAFK